MSLGKLQEGHFHTALSRDLMYMVLDDMIAEGQFRCVYPWLPNKDWVCKIEPTAASFSNVQEWDVWQRVKETKLAQWFAPVHQISGCGVIILQSRTKPVEAHELPKQVPAFFTDLKAANWGRLGKRIVCHDYGNNLLMEKGMTSRMRKANWF